MIGNVKVLDKGIWTVIDIRKINHSTGVLCPVCSETGIVRYTEVGTPYFCCESHRNSICKRAERTQNIKYISDMDGSALLENVLSANSKSSRTRIVTLENVYATGAHLARPTTKIKDGILSDYLVGNIKSVSMLKAVLCAVPRILCAKFGCFELKSQSIILTVSCPPSGNGNRTGGIVRLRLKFSHMKDFNAIKQLLMTYELSPNGFSEEKYYTDYLLVAGDWKAELRSECARYCNEKCEGRLKCYGMITSENTLPHQIYKVGDMN